MRVLIADDDAQMRGWLLRALSVMGHQAEAVDGADTLLVRAVEFNPDAVISDIQMPGGDGVAVGLWLQKTRPGCRIVLMTGDPGRAEEARAAGFARVLDKPFTLDGLASALSA